MYDDKQDVRSEDGFARMFDHIDKDGDGLISRSEMMSALPDEVDDAEFDQYLKEVDSDGDGFLNLDELMKLGRSEQEPQDATDSHHAEE